MELAGGACWSWGLGQSGKLGEGGQAAAGVLCSTGTDWGLGPGTERRKSTASLPVFLAGVACGFLLLVLTEIVSREQVSVQIHLDSSKSCAQSVYVMSSTIENMSSN